MRSRLVETEMGSLIMHHMETVEASFYSKAKTLLLFAEEGWTLGLALRFIAALCSIWLQQFALHSVDATLFFQWRFGQVDDQVQDKAFPGGAERPANYKFMNSFDAQNPGTLKGVPVTTYLPLLFCVFAVTLQLHDIIEEQRTLFLLIRRGPPFNHNKLTTVKEATSADSESPRRRFHILLERVDFVSRWAAAWLLHGARFCLLLKFLAVTVELLGTSDGALNLVLNSLALAFVLDFDRAASLIFTADGHLKHSIFGRLTRFRKNAKENLTTVSNGLETAFEDMLDTAHQEHRRLLRLFNYIERFKPMAVALVVFHLALRLQTYTSRGDYVTADDDFLPHQRTLTTYFNTNLDALGIVLLLSNHLAFALSAKKILPKHRRKYIWLRRILIFLAEVLFLVLILYQLVFGHLNNLIIRGDTSPSGGPHHLLDLISPLSSTRHNNNNNN